MKPRNKKTNFAFTAILILSFEIVASSLFAQESAEELAKIAQNPLANIMSFPFQNNTNFNYGPFSRVQNILNIQTAIPIICSKLHKS